MPSRTALVLVVLACWPASGRAQSAVLSATQRQAVLARMTAYRADRKMPALSVAIARAGRLVFADAIGLASIEDSVPASSRTRFRAASTQKALTATAILQLVASGRLALDTDVRDYCPAYPAQHWPITLRRLLLHQGGVRASDTPDVMSHDHYASVTEALARFAGDSLRFEPGTAFLYSNYGYVLLACAIEGASHQSYDEYLQAQVLGPAAMSATGPVNLYRVEPHRALSYLIRTADNTRTLQGLWRPAHLASSPLDQPFPADPVDPSFEPGAGNYWTTPTDLVRFVSALDAGRLLPDSLRILESTDQPAPSGTTPRPMGWTSSSYGALSVLQISGSDWNGSAAVIWIPSRHLAIAIASNINWDDPTALVQQLLDLL